MKNEKTKVDVILGLQWGDEGKGKFVDVLSPNYDVIARFQGGPNAGHTLEFEGSKHVLHTIPSGIFHKDKVNIIGNGVLIDAYIFQKEVKQLTDKGVDATERLKISDKANLILPSHRFLDMAMENRKGKDKIGSTIKGIGPAYTDKTARCGMRVKDIFSLEFRSKYENLKSQHLETLANMSFDVQKNTIENFSFEEYEKLWFEGVEGLKKFEIIQSEYYISQALKEGKRVLAEGAQGTLLDVDFGSYPFVTSSNTTSAGVCSGLGIPPSSIGKVYGVFKAYCTRVGSGPFPTELFDENGEKLRKEGCEFGATTGRPRRCGWLDLPALYYAIMLNGVTDLIITKADVMNNFDTITLCENYKMNGKRFEGFPSAEEMDNLQLVLKTLPGWKTDLQGMDHYQALPASLRDYLEYIEAKTEKRISIVSTGPDRAQTILKRDE